MQSDFTNVETELRDIENAFATGRMNAFGSASTQDAFVHELRRIAEIETQVFYRTCALLKSSNTNEHTLATNMYASAQPPPQSQRTGPSAMNSSGLGDNSFRGSAAGLENSTMHRSINNGGGNASATSRNARTPYQGSTISNGGRSGAASPGGSRSQSRAGRESMARSNGGGQDNGSGSTAPFSGGNDSVLGTSGAAPHIHQNEWGNEDGFSDKAFEDVAAHFDDLESQFASLGDYLREISKHVIRLNDMSEQVNNGGAALANSNSMQGGNTQSFGSPGRRVPDDSFDEHGGQLRFDETFSR